MNKTERALIETINNLISRLPLPDSPAPSPDTPPKPALPPHTPSLQDPLPDPRLPPTHDFVPGPWGTP